MFLFSPHTKKVGKKTRKKEEREKRRNKESQNAKGYVTEPFPVELTKVFSRELFSQTNSRISVLRKKVIIILAGTLGLIPNSSEIAFVSKSNTKTVTANLLTSFDGTMRLLVSLTEFLSLLRESQWRRASVLALKSQS